MHIQWVALLLAISNSAAANSINQLNHYLSTDGLSLTDEGKVSVDFGVAPWSLTHEEGVEIYRKKATSKWRDSSERQMMVTIDRHGRTDNTGSKGKNDYAAYTSETESGQELSARSVYAQTEDGRIKSTSFCYNVRTRTPQVECRTITQDLCSRLLKASGRKTILDLVNHLADCNKTVWDASVHLLNDKDIMEADTAAIARFIKMHKSLNPSMNLGKLKNSQTSADAARALNTGTAIAVTAIYCNQLFSDELAPSKSTAKIAPPKTKSSAGAAK